MTIVAEVFRVKICRIIGPPEFLDIFKDYGAFIEGFRRTVIVQSKCRNQSLWRDFKKIFGLHIGIHFVCGSNSQICWVSSRKPTEAHNTMQRTVSHKLRE